MAKDGQQLEKAVKIYAFREISEIIGDFTVYHVTPENRAECQYALDSDLDNKFKVKSGHALIRDDAGRIWLHSNGSYGYAAGGTTVYAQIV